MIRKLLIHKRVNGHTRHCDKHADCELAFDKGHILTESIEYCTTVCR